MSKKFTTRFKERAADTLIEVMVALFVLTLGSLAATSLVVSSLQANTFSKDSLVAVNLAVEGIEAIRNIRDTNWIKFAYDKENCWLMYPDKQAGDNCSGANLIDTGYYSVDLNASTYAWELTQVETDTGTGLNMEDGITSTEERYQLFYIDINAGVDSDGNGGANDDRDIYVSKAIYDSVPAQQVNGSKFYRAIFADLDGSGERMDVTSLVQWRAGNAVHQIELISTLTNFNRVKI